MKIYDIAKCPPYYAISYCWGNPADLDIVLLGGKEMAVTRNCWCSLWQARTQAKPGLYWIDSICIDQANLQEKATQVHRIAAIFANAIEVWACLGPDSDDSAFLVQSLVGLSPVDASSFIDPDPKGLSDEVRRRTINWLVSLDGNFRRFATALVAFGRRPFFSRMWIYQEISLASTVKMICGIGTANMQALKDIVLVCSTLIMRFRPHQDYIIAQNRLMELLAENNYLLVPNRSGHLQELSIIVHRLHSQKENSRTIDFGSSDGIVAIQGAIQPLQCQDPRDKIFAIISVFGRSCNILPDYNISSFDLAIQVLGEYSRCGNLPDCVKLADKLCVNLRLDPSTQAATCALGRNQALRHMVDNLTSPSLPQQTDCCKMLRQTTPFACQMLLNECGQLTAPFRCEVGPRDVEMKAMIADRPPEPPHPPNSNVIVVNETVVAMVPNGAVAGDWIVPLDYYNCYPQYCLGLVLRSRTGNEFDVVGEVAFFPGYTPCISWENCGCQFGPDFHTDYTTDFEIMFAREELLLLSIRLRAPFDAMRPESHPRGRPKPELPAGPPLSWRSTFAVRRDSVTPIGYPAKPRTRGRSIPHAIV